MIFWSFWGFGVGFGVLEGLQSIEACSEIHLDGFSAREVQYSCISDSSSDFLFFPQDIQWPDASIFTDFSARSARIRHCQFFRSDLKDARRTIMQIDGGITSRSLFFVPVRPI